MADRRRRRGANCRRQRRREDEARRVGADGVDDVGAAGDIAAEAAERLCQSALDHIDALRDIIPLGDAAAARVKAVLNAAGLPVMPSDTHIVPLFVGDPEKVKAASDMLLADHGIYIQPINYPTVPRGMERLRITPSPYHDDVLIDALAEALVDVWERLKLPRRGQQLAAE